jgi:hypothetical protein
MDNQTQSCRTCGKTLPFSDFHEHLSMKTGYSKRCKSCTRDYSIKRLAKLKSDPVWAEKEKLRCREKENKRRAILKNNPVWVEKEKKRIREQERRLKWKRQKPSKDKIRINQLNTIARYPEKQKVRYICCRMPKAEGLLNHHWSYNIEHAKDVIQMTKESHYLVHRFTIYDQERMMYRKLDGTLIDSRESAIEYYATLKDE